MEDGYFDNELDALRYVYEGDAIETEGEGLRHVEVVIRPYLDSAAARVELCQARLRLSFLPDDPNSTTVCLVETKGMEDDVAGALMHRLEAELGELRGSPALFSHLCETARQHATAANRPAGHCAVCLGDLEEGDPGLAKLEPCWHLFHAPCLARLALWRAEEVAEAAREKAENLGRPLKPSSLPGPTAVPLSCPVCRVAFTPDQVPGLIGTIKEVASGKGSGRPGAAQPALREAPVPEGLRAGLGQLQRRFERILRVQRDAGGLYEKKSYLIDESTRVAAPQGSRSSRDASPTPNASAGTSRVPPQQERDRPAGRAPPPQPPPPAKPSGSEDAASASAPPVRPRGPPQVVVVVPGTSGRPAPAAEASRLQSMRQPGAEGTDGSRKPRQPSGRGRGSEAGGAGRGAVARPAPDPSGGDNKGEGPKSEATKGRPRGRRPEAGGGGSGKAGPGSKRDVGSAPAAGASATSMSGRLRGGAGAGGSTSVPAAGTGGQAGIPQEATAAAGAG